MLCDWVPVYCTAESTVCTQGLVTTLHEGEDFGQLALVNDAPRAATIILREDNCHFLRVDKQDFIRILKVCRFPSLLHVDHHNSPTCLSDISCLLSTCTHAWKRSSCEIHTNIQISRLSFRMWRLIRCDWKSTGRLCWCWRRAQTRLTKEEQGTAASKRLMQNTAVSLHAGLWSLRPGCGLIMCCINNAATVNEGWLYRSFFFPF